MANLLAFTKFQIAEREYLHANGWIEDGKGVDGKDWIVPETIPGGWAGDRVTLDYAIKFQKDMEKYSIFRGELA